MTWLALCYCDPPCGWLTLSWDGMAAVMLSFGRWEFGGARAWRQEGRGCRRRFGRACLEGRGEWNLELGDVCCGNLLGICWEHVRYWDGMNVVASHWPCSQGVMSFHLPACGTKVLVRSLVQSACRPRRNRPRRRTPLSHTRCKFCLPGHTSFLCPHHTFYTSPFSLYRPSEVEACCNRAGIASKPEACNSSAEMALFSGEIVAGVYTWLYRPAGATGHTRKGRTGMASLPGNGGARAREKKQRNEELGWGEGLN